MVLTYNADNNNLTLSNYVDSLESKYTVQNVIITAWYTGYRTEGNTTTQVAWKAVVIVEIK